MKNLFLLLILLGAGSILAQKGGGYRGGEVACGGGDFGFEVNGVLYESGDDLYICRADLPVTLILADLQNNTIPYIGTSYLWTKATADSIGQWSAQVDTTHLGSKQCITTKVVFFDVDGKKQTVKLKINTNLSFVQLKSTAACHATAQYAFDENVYSNYPFYEKDVPWKFLLGSIPDTLPLKNSVQHIKNINTVLSDSGPMALDQTLVGTDLEIKHILGSRDSVYSHVCSSHQLFRADVYPTVKTYDLHIWTVRESDDDQINYCLSSPWLKKNCQDSIKSDTFQCLLPGVDGTFDLYKLDPVDQPWIDWINDTVIRPKSFAMRVEAGHDRRCSSDPMPTSNALENAPAFSMFDLESTTNAILNTAGVQMDFIDYGVVNANFDVYDENGETSPAEGYELIRALVYLENLKGNLIGSSTAKVIVSNKLEDPSNGIRTGQSQGGGFATIIDGTRKYERTLAHEIGHAIWNLQHPDEQDATNNPIGIDKLLGVVNDPLNLMTSGSGAGGSTNVNNSLIRRYVWRIMQDGR